MAIDQFIRERFEQALPRDKKTGASLWRSLGVRGGEYCYIVSVKDGVQIYVRSTVTSQGIAADTAEDSIRCWLTSDDQGTPLGSKVVRWISRVNGWDQRLAKALRKLFILGLQAGRCPNCQKRMGIFKSKTETNKGKWFSMCSPCNKFGRWVSEETV